MRINFAEEDRKDQARITKEHYRRKRMNSKSRTRARGGFVRRVPGFRRVHDDAKYYKNSNILRPRATYRSTPKRFRKHNVFSYLIWGVILLVAFIFGKKIWRLVKALGDLGNGLVRGVIDVADFSKGVVAGIGAMLSGNNNHVKVEQRKTNLGKGAFDPGFWRSPEVPLSARVAAAASLPEMKLDVANLKAYLKRSNNKANLIPNWNFVLSMLKKYKTQMRLSMFTDEFQKGFGYNPWKAFIVWTGALDGFAYGESLKALDYIESLPKY